MPPPSHWKWGLIDGLLTTIVPYLGPYFRPLYISLGEVAYLGEGADCTLRFPMILTTQLRLHLMLLRVAQGMFSWGAPAFYGARYLIFAWRILHARSLMCTICDHVLLTTTNVFFSKIKFWQMVLKDISRYLSYQLKKSVLSVKYEKGTNDFEFLLHKKTNKQFLKCCRWFQITLVWSSFFSKLGQFFSRISGDLGLNSPKVCILVGPTHRLLGEFWMTFRWFLETSKCKEIYPIGSIYGIAIATFTIKINHSCR